MKRCNRNEPWTCSICTLINDADAISCAACNATLTEDEEEGLETQETRKRTNNNGAPPSSPSPQQRTSNYVARQQQQQQDVAELLLTPEEREALRTSLSDDKEWWPSQRVLWFMTDYAKTAKSKCRACSRIIGKGQIRCSIAEEDHLGEGLILPYFHLVCMPWPEDRLKLNDGQTLSDGQFDAISKTDKARVLAAIDYVYRAEVIATRKSALASKIEAQKATSATARVLGDIPLEFGKYKGQTFAYVVARDPGYAQWAVGVDNNGWKQTEGKGSLGAFRRYCYSQGFRPN